MQPMQFREVNRSPGKAEPPAEHSNDKARQDRRPRAAQFTDALYWMRHNTGHDEALAIRSNWKCWTPIAKLSSPILVKPFLA